MKVEIYLKGPKFFVVVNDGTEDNREERMVRAYLNGGGYNTIDEARDGAAKMRQFVDASSVLIE